MPYLATRAKMLWDDYYFYVAADMEDPDCWGTLTKRDSVICGSDTDFEVFIDPDGDAMNYMELEINTLNCVWDLLLDQPHHRKGDPTDEWDFEGLESAVQVDGTLNAPWSWTRDGPWRSPLTGRAWRPRPSASAAPKNTATSGG